MFSTPLPVTRPTRQNTDLHVYGGPAPPTLHAPRSAHTPRLRVLHHVLAQQVAVAERGAAHGARVVATRRAVHHAVPAQVARAREALAAHVAAEVVEAAVHVLVHAQPRRRRERLAARRAGVRLVGRRRRRRPRRGGAGRAQRILQAEKQEDISQRSPARHARHASRVHRLRCAHLLAPRVADRTCYVFK